MRKCSIVLSFVVASVLVGGCSRLGIGRRTSVPGFELMWTNRVDPRAMPGMENKEDGITVECVEFSLDGKLVAAGNGQGEINIYSTADGSKVRELVYTTNPHTAFSTSFKGMEVECLYFSADGKLLAAGGNEQGIKVFRLDDGTVVQTFEADGAEVDGMAMSPDGKYFAHASRQSVTVRRLSDWKEVHHVPHKGGSAVNSVDFTQDGRHMISAGQYERVMVTHTPDWQEVRTCLVEPKSSIKSTRFSPDGKYIAAGFGPAKQIVVFRFDDASVVKQIPMPCYIEAVAWTSDGAYLLAGGRDEGLLHVFSTDDWTEIAAIPGQDNASIEYIDTFKDLVAVGGEDGHIRLFRINAG
jgi:WD40 repeat protein